jgi:Na+/H+ antiporter NhaD/arsenite permease-like protein
VLVEQEDGDMVGILTLGLIIVVAVGFALKRHRREMHQIINHPKEYDQEQAFKRRMNWIFAPVLMGMILLVWLAQHFH